MTDTDYDQAAAPLDAGPDREQAREMAYQMLKRAIMQGSYRPAHHLVEQAIARRLKVSKTPVREALSRLEQEGLVESFPHRGFFVKDYDERDVREIYELRELYEGACARLAAQRPDASEVADELEALNSAAEVALGAGRIDEVHDLFTQYDEIIFAQTDNRLLQEEISRIRARIHLSGVVTNRIPGRITKSLEQHGAIIEAIRAGDANAADESTAAHIRSLRDDELAHRRLDLSWPVVG